MLAHTIRFAKL